MPERSATSDADALAPAQLEIATDPEHLCLFHDPWDLANGGVACIDCGRVFEVTLRPASAATFILRPTNNFVPWRNP